MDWNALIRLWIATTFGLALVACESDEQADPTISNANPSSTSSQAVLKPMRLEAIPDQFHGCWELDETAEFDPEPGISAKALGYASQLTISATEIRQDFGWPDGTSDTSMERLDQALMANNGRLQLDYKIGQSQGAIDLRSIVLVEENGRTLLYPGGDATVVLSPYRRCGSEPSERTIQSIAYLPERFVGSWVYLDESCDGDSPSRLDFTQNRMTVVSFEPEGLKASAKIDTIHLYPDGEALISLDEAAGGDLGGQSYSMMVEDELLHGNIIGNGVNRSDPPRKRCSF